MKRTANRVRALNSVMRGDVLYDARRGDFYDRDGVRIGGSARRTYAELMGATLATCPSGEGKVSLALTELGHRRLREWAPAPSGN